MRHRFRIAVPALAALAAGALFGCANPPPKSAPDTTRLDSAAIDMITDSGTFPALRYLIDKATERATRRCMRAAGLRWSGFAGVAPAASDEDRILDPRARRRYGYGITGPASGTTGDTGTGGDDDPGMMAALVGSPPKRATLTLPGMAQYSFPTSGCLAEGRAAVAGDPVTWARLSYLPPELGLRLRPAIGTDPRYLAAQQAWRRCMADHRHPYATPADIRTDLIRRVSARPERRADLRAQEITLAVQDARCDHEAHLTRTELALRRAAAQTVDPATRREITGLTAALHAAAGRARRILR